MINKLFDRYIELTKNILSGINNGISVDEFFSERQKVIDSIIELDINKNLKKKAYISSGAEDLDISIIGYLKEEMKNTKRDIKKATENKKVYSSYVSNNISGSFFRRTV